MKANDVAQKKLLPWILCLLGVSFYFYASVIAIMPNNIVTQLLQSFQLSATKVSFFGTCYFIAYASCLIPGGMLLDTWPERRILPLAILLCGLGTLIFALTPSFAIALVGRMISGIGGGFGLLGTIYLVNKWLPKKYFGLYLGLAFMIGLSGGLLQRPLAVVINSIGWRMTLTCLGMLGLIMSGLMYLITKKLTQAEAQKLFTNTTLIKDLKLSCYQIMQKPNNWFLASYGGLMFVPMSILSSLWGISLLQAYYQNYDKPILAGINSFIFLGWIIGSPLLGWLSDFIKQRRFVIRFCSVGLFLTLVTINYLINLPLDFTKILMFLTGVFSAGSAIFFTMTAESNNAKTVATALGFVNALALVPDIIAQPVFGLILDHYASNKSVLAIFTWAAYQHAMILLIVLVILAMFISWFFIKETHPDNA